MYSMVTEGIGLPLSAATRWSTSLLVVVDKPGDETVAFGVLAGKSSGATAGAAACSCAGGPLAPVVGGVRFSRGSTSKPATTPVTPTAIKILALVEARNVSRSEEHTSELQSLRHLVCR